MRVDGTTRKSTSVRLNPAVLPRLKKVAQQREVSQAQAIEEAVSLWIERDSDLPEGERRVPLPSAYANIAEKLARVLAALEYETDELVRSTVRQIEMSVKWLELWASEHHA